MKVIITGGGGFLGSQLATKILDKGTLTGPSGEQEPIENMVLIDARFSVPQSDDRVQEITGDISDRDVIDSTIDGSTNVSIFHLASMVSGECEERYDDALRVNLDGGRNVFEAARAAAGRPRVVFASSIASFGGAAMPTPVSDLAKQTPQTTYGMTKAMCELLINDYSRRGEIDGLVLRLPTIVIRPGRPNAAASSFASSILREPLNGEEAICPVPTTLEMFVMSPGKVVDALEHGAQVPREALAPFRAFMLPGITVSVAAMLEALRTAAGEQALALVKHAPDPRIEAIVASWPARFETAKASQLGFVGDDDFTQIIDSFMAEQHP